MTDNEQSNIFNNSSSILSENFHSTRIIKIEPTRLNEFISKLRKVVIKDSEKGFLKTFLVD